MPAVAKPQRTRALKFIPNSDLAILDPMWTPAYITRNHGYLIYDTLYGQTGKEYGFKCTPQMVAGHVTDGDGKIWKLTLRDGLWFHNGERVLAADCAASIRRWGARDAFGQALMARTEEVSAPDDKTIMFRLKQPFPLLPEALGHAASNMCAIMPKRIAETEPTKQISEAIGSRPFRFKAE
jgi:peptide/nickel transport system substrate-binding protein